MGPRVHEPPKFAARHKCDRVTATALLILIRSASVASVDRHGCGWGGSDSAAHAQCMHTSVKHLRQFLVQFVKLLGCNSMTNSAYELGEEWDDRRKALKLTCSPGPRGVAHTTGAAYRVRA